MALDVTVALLADPIDPYGSMISKDEMSRLYGERRKVRLGVDLDDNLASVLRTARVEFGIQPPPTYRVSSLADAHGRVAFFQPADESSPIKRATGRLYWSQLVLVDDRGLAVFGVSDKRTVLMRDLVRAAEFGTLEGDPLKPYLIVEPGWGDAPPPDWPTFIEGLKVVWSVIEVAATAGGAGAAAKAVWDLVRSRTEKGAEAVEAHRDWAQRGVRPHQFDQLIRTRDWTSAELGALLGCSASEAEAILWTLGFAMTSEGVWVFAGDDAARLVQEISLAIAFSTHGPADWESDLRARVQEIIDRDDTYQED